MRTAISRLSIAAIVVAAATLTACGGGGGGGATGVTPNVTPTPASNIPGQTQMNALTAYTVYQGTANGTTYLEVQPLNVAPGTLANAQAVPGAIVQYPDGSVQVADVLGNFDASQSSWAQANQNQLLSNPNFEPEIIAFNPGQNVSPADAYVQAYASVQSLVSAGHMRGMTSSNELAGVDVFPRGYALFDTETRTYHAVGVDSSGTFAGLSGTSITWSLATPNGCGAPAGKITADANDATRAVYAPPASGTFPSGCQDEVVAMVASNGANYSGSGNAFYYDPSTAVTLTGVLNNSSNAPVANGIVDLYGGGREFYHGKLYAIANSSGQFTRLVPPNRTLYPFAGNPSTANGKTTYAFFTVTPATIAVGGSGSTTTQNLAESTTPAVNPFKPLPPLERAIRDSWWAKDIAEDGLPFGGAKQNGQFPAGSLEAILASPSANGTGTLSSGPFSGWSYTWDASATNVVVQQPSTQEAGRHVMQFTLAATTAYPISGSTSCPSGNSCFNFVEYYNPASFTSPVASPLVQSALPTGTILANDGSFAQSVSSSAFTVSVSRNVYSVGHQTAGSPLYNHSGTFSQTLSTTPVTLNISDTWTDAAGHTIATYTGTRVNQTSPVLFTYSGNGTRTFYKPDGTQLASVAFSVTNGTLNNDHSGGFTMTYSSGLPNPSDNGTVVNWTLNAGSGATRATGNVQNPNVTGLTTSNVATFTLSNTLIVTVTTDPSLGGNTIAFHL